MFAYTHVLAPSCRFLLTAGPSYSSSTVTDILSVPASLDTSLSAPPGDPTLTPSQQQPPRKSKLNPSRSLDKPPLAPTTLLTDEPLTPLGPGSPTHPVNLKSNGVPSLKSEIGFQNRQDDCHATHDIMLEFRAQYGSSSFQPACSHLTKDLAAVKQQEEERRASNAQAETSSSPAKGVTAGHLTRHNRPNFAHCPAVSSTAARQTASAMGTSPSGAKGPVATAAGSTPFELASQRFLQEHGAVSTAPKSQSLTSHTADKTRAKHAQRAQHADEELEPIGGSSSEAEGRLVHTLQALRCACGSKAFAVLLTLPQSKSQLHICFALHTASLQPPDVCTMHLLLLNCFRLEVARDFPQGSLCSFPMCTLSWDLIPTCRRPHHENIIQIKPCAILIPRVNLHPHHVRWR